jgi:16S rRNA (guanine527-N7)-methyltransferase
VSDAGRAAALAALDVSRETAARLDAFAAVLGRWAPRINLVARGTLADLWRRHIFDSAQLLPLAPAGARIWADLGSGAGFPGLIVAILAAEAAPRLEVTLVEADARKAAFLAEAARVAEAPVRILAERAEAAAPLAADVVSARALAPLPALLPLVHRHLAPGGVALLPKGAGHGRELDAALECWRFSVQKHPSRTDPAAAILAIGDLARA